MSSTCIDSLLNLPLDHLDHVCLFVSQMWSSISELITECFKTEILHKFRVIFPTLFSYSQLLPNIPTNTRVQHGVLTPILAVPSCSSSDTCLSSPHILCWLFIRKNSFTIARRPQHFIMFVYLLPFYIFGYMLTSGKTVGWVWSVRYYGTRKDTERWPWLPY